MSTLVGAFRNQTSAHPALGTGIALAAGRAFFAGTFFGWLRLRLGA